MIKLAFDSADDLHLIGESLIALQKLNCPFDPGKFMAHIRSQTVDKEMVDLLLDAVQLIPDEQKQTREARLFTKIDDPFRMIAVTGDTVPAQVDGRGS